MLLKYVLSWQLMEAIVLFIGSKMVQIGTLCHSLLSDIIFNFYVVTLMPLYYT